MHSSHYLHHIDQLRYHLSAADHADALDQVDHRDRELSIAKSHLEVLAAIPALANTTACEAA